MQVRRLGLLLLLIAVVAAVGIFLAQKTEPRVRPQAPVPDLAPPAPEAPVAEGGKKRARIPKPERAVRGDPRPAAAPATETVVPAPAPSKAPATLDAPLDSGILPPLGAVDPDRPFTPESIQASAGELSPEIASCMEEWQEVVGDFRGRVVLGFQLAPEGLTDVWIEDNIDVPAPVLGCFSAAIWEQTWPMPEAPTTVTFPFEAELGPE